MAQKVEVKLIDDLDGSEATQTVLFGLDGREYEIDLNDQHTAELREALAPFLGGARKKAGTGRLTAVRRPGVDGPARDLAKVREWARTNGYDVNDRGRVSGKILEAFDKAHAA